jgi:hypothetical protein
MALRRPRPLLARPAHLLLLLIKLLLQDLIELRLKRRVLLDQRLLVLNKLLQLLLIELVNKLFIVDGDLLLLEAHVFCGIFKMRNRVKLLLLDWLILQHLLG